MGFANFCGVQPKGSKPADLKAAVVVLNHFSRLSAED
jgi:hypothetical protein